MSIRLLQSIFIAGVLSPVDGSTLSLSPALEADLVNQGKAAWVAAPELTASELAHASAHARMRQPNGVPIILAQSAIPMILPSSGTMGANGALTGLTALPYSTFPQPCFMYFPAGKVFSGSPAGMYYAILTSATAATVYNNMYTSGLPQSAVPATPTAVVDAGPGAYTQTTASDLELIRTVIPGGMMGLNGTIRAWYSFGYPNNANNKTLTRKFGGTTIAASTRTTAVCDETMALIKNRNSASVQRMQINSAPGTAYGVAFVTGAIDTTQDANLSVFGQLAVATDFAIIDLSTIEILPG